MRKADNSAGGTGAEGSGGPPDGSSGAVSARPDAESSPGSPPPAEAVVELLSVLAYGHLVAFDTMAADARLAPDLTRRAMLCEMAAGEITHYRRLTARVEELGADPGQTMRRYAAALTAYHEQTPPGDWLEGLVKAYVGEGIADDFYREVAGFLASPDRELVLEVLHDTRYADFAEKEIKRAIQDDPRLANRLALWARRLVGEALTQAQRVAAEQDALASLVMEGSGDLAAVTALIRRITSAHTERMTAVGLSN